MKKKIVFSFILGMIVSGMSVYAGISLTSDKVGYKDTTIEVALNSLFTEAVDGKNSITTALSNKGFNVNNNSTYSEIVNGINELPVTIEKDSDGNWGYIKDGEDTITPFSGTSIYDLGSGTSFDIKSLFPNDYQNFTNDNFITTYDLCPGLSTVKATWGDGTAWAQGTFSRGSKSYDATTGILTLTKVSMRADFYWSSSSESNKTVTGTPKAYLVIGKIN